MGRRYKYDDEMDEMDEGACGGYDEGEDEMDDEEMEESYTPRRRSSGRRLSESKLVEHNELLTRANNRSARVLQAYSAFANSGLNEAQMIDVLNRLDNPYNFTISEFGRYVAEAIDAYQRGDRKPGLFEFSEHRAAPGQRSLNESADHRRSVSDPASQTLSVLARMNRQRPG